MLFLQLPAETAAQVVAEPLPIDDATALALERALLAGDNELRRIELAAALAASPSLAGWAMRTVEIRTGQTINHVAEATAWLSSALVGELATSLKSEGSSSTTNDVGWRLPMFVAQLAAAENRCTEFEHRLEHEKLESLKELAYGASHEINNPLANIAARAQTLLEDETHPERQRKLVAIHRQAMRAHEMISDLMLFARPPKLNRTEVDLRQLVTQVVGELSELAREKAVQLCCEHSHDPITLSADSTQLGVAISAVTRNAIEAVRESGHIHVATRSEKGSAFITVSDDGPGISPEIRRHMFDPFFSGREAGRGLGFGLSKSWRIITDHGGEIDATSQLIGAQFEIRLPIELASSG
ncbi:MAG TPA: HAMP domain-containing sensor histidine kinase [Lacipirellulaceae bacterium]|jgi:hypothetical protein|nr:HAMP domain-containing sensor histidine kinase [Lacipirellulaceae bacterium]